MSGRSTRRAALSLSLSAALTTALLTLAGPAVVLCGGARAATLVKVGAYEFPPYVSDAEPGVTAAFLEVLNASQDELRFVLVPTSPQRRYEDMEQGRFDMIAFESLAWGWQNHPVDATRVFLQDAEVFVAKAAPDIDQSFFNRLDGKTILGRLGFHYAFAGYNADPAELERRYRMRVTMTHEGNVRNVVAGRATLAIVTRSFLNRFLRANPDIAPKILVSERTDQIYEHTILIRRGAPISVAWMNALLDRLESTGALAALWRASGITDTSHGPNR